MDRQPIVSDSLNVVMIQNATTATDLLPDYQFQFQGKPPFEEAENMFGSLVEFIQTNEEMAVANIETKDEYIKGFKRALALTRLWMNSLYLTDNSTTTSNIKEHPR